MPKPFTPRPWQPAMSQHILGNKRCGLFVPMGLGKSGATLSALHDLQLVEDDPILVIAPLRVASDTWPSEVAKWSQFSGAFNVVAMIGDGKQRAAALDRALREGGIATINYENLPWLVERLETQKKSWPFKTVVTDECFVVGTLVATPDGEFPIETLKCGTMVLTRKGPRKILNVFRKQTESLVEVRLIDGTRIVCTPSHLFWTDGGWTPAERLNRATAVHKAVRPLRAAIRVDSFEGLGGGQRPILSEGMRDISLVGGDESGEIAQPCGRPARMAEGESQLERRRSDGGNYEGEIEGGVIRPGLDSTRQTRRQWPGDVTGRGEHRGISPAGMGVESCDPDARGVCSGYSEFVQTGLRVAAPDGLSGDRWPHTSRDEGKTTRRQERTDTIRIGVESVTPVQCGSACEVWDIEVEGEHEFFAAGILVHNCSKLKGFRLKQGTQRARALAKVVHKYVDRYIGLTGTPASNGLQDLWAQLWMIDGGQRLGRTFSAFTQRWFRPAFNGFGVEPLPFAHDEIHQRINDVCLSLNAADWFDLKEPVKNVVEVQLPARARGLYAEMERTFFAEIDGHEVEAFNAASKSMKLLQLCSGAAYVGEDSTQWVEVHTAKVEALESVVEEAAGMPVLVLYHFKSSLARLLKAFPGALNLGTAEGLRDAKKGKGKVWLGHPASMGHGIDGLQEHTNIVCFFDLNWNLEEHMQAIERVGPTRQMQAGKDRPVYVHYLVAKDTVDEVVMQRIESKREIQDLLLESLRRRKE